MLTACIGLLLHVCAAAWIPHPEYSQTRAEYTGGSYSKHAFFIWLAQGAVVAESPLYSNLPLTVIIIVLAPKIFGVHVRTPRRRRGNGRAWFLNDSAHATYFVTIPLE